MSKGFEVWNETEVGITTRQVLKGVNNERKKRIYTINWYCTIYYR